MVIRTLLTGFIFFISQISCAQPAYKNQNLSFEARAEDLVKRLTIEEKISLMMNAAEAVPRLEIKPYEWWNEALHGVARNGTATVFPQAIGMAASFDDSLLYNIFTIISDEARIKHRQSSERGEYKRYQGLTMWTPNINIFRDPRWGRGQETYGEDPFLTGKMGVAVIKGLQGDNNQKYDKLHACAKHYAVHSGPEWNRHSFNAENITSRDLWETYLPAFKDAVNKANVKEVMCAYNRFEGEPCCGSNRLLTQILRQHWGFEGIILSDCGAIDNFYKPDRHMTHADSAHASSAAVLSGTDLECGSSYKSLINAVKQGLIKEEQIDVSLKRLLKARFELGEIDGASHWENLHDSLVNCAEHRQMALKLAHKSIVLLKNNGILPISGNTKIALFGPNANDSVMQWGNYNGFPKHTITLLEALNEQVGGSGVLYDAICGHTGLKESVYSECWNKGKEGFSAEFWNNTEMKGEPASKIQFGSAIKFGRRDTIAPGVNLNNISAKFYSTYSPKISGKADFIFTTSSRVKLFIERKHMPLQKIPKSLQVYSMEVEAGKSYTIDIELVHEKQGEFRFNIERTLQPDIAKILKMTEGIDVIVFAGGISASLEREDANVYAPGFRGGDRISIELPQIQRDVISALKKAGKKVILVNFSGSAMGLVPENQFCDAILQAWYPGETGGKAVADVLFGKYNPAGRLPVTFYRNTEQLPDYENYEMKGRTYRYLNEEPLYPFGYGLSYTVFEYGQPWVNTPQILAGNGVTLTVPVKNTGKYNGEEVVQVYLKKEIDIDGPNKTLREFKRVFIKAGETANVVFELTGENLEWWDPETNTMHTHLGNYRLMTGGSSKDEDLQTIPLILK